MNQNRNDVVSANLFFQIESPIPACACLGKPCTKAMIPCIHGLHTTRKLIFYERNSRARSRAAFRILRSKSCTELLHHACESCQIRKLGAKKKTPTGVSLPNRTRSNAQAPPLKRRRMLIIQNLVGLPSFAPLFVGTGACTVHSREHGQKAAVTPSASSARNRLPKIIHALYRHLPCSHKKRQGRRAKPPPGVSFHYPDITSPHWGIPPGTPAPGTPAPGAGTAAGTAVIASVAGGTAAAAAAGGTATGTATAGAGAGCAGCGGGTADCGGGTACCGAEAAGCGAGTAGCGTDTACWGGGTACWG